MKWLFTMGPGSQWCNHQHLLNSYFLCAGQSLKHSMHMNRFTSHSPIRLSTNLHIYWGLTTCQHSIANKWEGSNPHSSSSEPECSTTRAYYKIFTYWQNERLGSGGGWDFLIFFFKTSLKFWAISLVSVNDMEEKRICVRFYKTNKVYRAIFLFKSLH